MSSSYSTMQQYAPLRVPSSFDQQGKALIVQLNETFDDIYRRFGRLRLEDMGKEFRQEWKTEQETVDILNAELGIMQNYRIMLAVTEIVKRKERV